MAEVPRRRARPRTALGLVAALAQASLALTACGEPSNIVGPASLDLAAAPGADDEASLVGAGSTFVTNLLAGWSEQYLRVAPGVTIAYDAAGSPEGVSRLRERSVDFATSDLPLTDLEEVYVGGSAQVTQVPWAAGAIGVLYNLPGVGGLRLTPQVVAGIFSGSVQRWNAEVIRADNPAADLPNLAIQVVHRSDASATTALFTRYLKEAGGSRLPAGPTISWPRGTGAQGSAGVAAGVARTEGAIGYAQVSYAAPAELDVALLRNRSGAFVAPTPDAVAAALAAAETDRFEPTLSLYFLADSPGSYPLSTVSYLLYRRDLEDPAKAAAMRHFADWALGEGQRSAESLGYAPVPLAIRRLASIALQRP